MLQIVDGIDLLNCIGGVGEPERPEDRLLRIQVDLSIANTLPMNGFNPLDGLTPGTTLLGTIMPYLAMNDLLTLKPLAEGAQFQNSDDDK